MAPLQAAGVCEIGISQYVCSSISAGPGTSTRPTGLSNSGQVVGFDGLSRQSFLYSGTAFSSLPGAAGKTATLAFGTNGAGQYSGYTLETASGGEKARGFLYSGGSYMSLNAPGAANTYAFDVNASGSVVGASESGGVATGFVYSGGVYSTILAPGAISTYVYGINDAGMLAGTYVTGSGAVAGFTVNNGSYTPIMVAGAKETYVRGLNSLGDVVGEYVDNLGTHGFVRLGSGEFWKFDVTGAAATYASAINDTRIVAGYFGSASSYQGFLANPTPVPLPGALPLFCAGLALLCRRRRATLR